MSAKHSLTSSAGETISSTHSSGSSRRRKLKLPQERIPPQFMGKEERLMHIRNAVTRLKYVQERILHMVSLDQAGGDDVNEILGQLQYLVPLLESNPHPNPVDQKDGPKQLDHLETEVKKLSKVVEEAIRMAEKTPNEEKSVYPGLKRKLLLESQQELHEIQELLTQKDGEVVSRVNTDGLQDMVSMHINDFDALFDTRLTAMVNERLREHSFFSATVRESFFPGAEPKGAVSPMLLDVVVGVRPSRCAYGVLHNAVKIIEKITERIETSKQVLESLEGKEGEDKKLVEFNLEKHVLLLEKTSTGLRHLESLQTRWTKEEEEIFKKVFVEKDLTNLLYAKRQSEDDIVTEAVRICDELLYEALPFASPQYCRRYSETYSNPCMLRLGFKLSSDYAQKDELNGKTHVALYSTSALFLKLMADRSIPEDKHREYDYLVPSSEQFWVPFGDFPEIVGGARCVLRGLKSKHDKFRALDEVKELGGYFIVNGGERILRALLMQRCNVPLNVERASFADLGVKFSEKAVTMRCKRQSGRTLYQYFYYSKTGNILLSFSRRTTWQVPVTLLTLCCGVDNPSTSELFRLLSVGLNVSANHKDRVETILQHHLSQPYGSLTHYVDYLSVLGRLYANYHETSMRFRFLPEFAANTQIHHDAWYGMFMLRAHLLPHLNAPVTTPPLAPDATPEELRAWLPEALQTELRNKFDVLIAAMRQLLVFNDGGSSHQGMDVPSYQEIFTVSQIFMCIFGTATSIFEKQIASRLAGVLPYTLFQALLTQNHKEMSNSMKQFREFATDALRGKTAPNYMAPVQKLLLTGTMKLEDDRDFYNPQNTGWSVLTDHLNFYRFFEQLRCVHRGTVIAGMRSSEVRRYPGEAYGFICMVHSPDGADCGVLNHLSVSTILSKGLYPDDEDTLHVSGKDSMKTLEKWIGKAFPQVRPTSSTATVDTYVETVPVWLEGKILGYTTPEEAEKGVTMLRKSKAITKRSMVGADGLIALSSLSPLHTLEVVYIPPENKEPKGVYLFCDSGRLMRPIQHIAGFGKESSTDLAFPHLYVGTWEQMWLDIAAVPSDLKDAVVQLGKKYEYMEQNGSNIISLTATTIPFFEYNCSPRNLFQCGLSKQSSGTQLQSMAWRREAKLFRTYFPQRYISRTLPMDYYNLDDVNLGVNAVVAILAYTGFDMDDAVILNSSASQRGMLNAGITIGKVITATGVGSDSDTFVFQNLLATGERFTQALEANGLPPKRTFAHLEDKVNFTTDHKYPSLHKNTEVYCVAKRVESVDNFTNQKKFEYSAHKTVSWGHFDKGEDAWVHSVIPLAYNGPDPVSVLVVFRIPRPPAVGDKFSSRHGQKGTLPLHIRSHDLPFSSQTGITPDVIINPHAFPSRMTVGMVLEMMTAKVGAVEGRFVDNSAWSTVDESTRLAEDIGDALTRSGYNRYGREKFIDGVSGEEMEADVFVGISGYQRLRHMVNDKWQARARTDARKFRAVTKTGQPVKGRKNHGGIRVGEMERDALLSYGMSEVVLDRLVRSSDETRAYVCTECGSLLSIVERYASEHNTWRCCTYCGAGKEESTDTIAMVTIPQVLRLWVAELASIGVRVVLRVE